VQKISERLVKQGFEVDVICTDSTGKLHRLQIINKVKVIRFRSIAPNNAYYFAPQIYFYLKKHDYDVIHAHNYHALPALFASLAKKDAKFVFTPHYHRGGHTFIRNLLHKPYKLIGSQIFKKAQKVICVSKYEMSLVKKDFRVPDSNLVRIQNGIDLDDLKNFKKTAHEYQMLLYIGRLEKYKGVQYILEALPQLPDYRLKIIGKGLYEGELKKLAESIGVDSRVEFLKDLSRRELLKHYASADVFLMLSKHEAYGITVAEALASGIPCIVAKGSALDEFVDGNMCVGLEYPIDIKGLVNAILIQTELDDKVKSGVKLQSWDEVTDKILKEVYEV